MPRHRRILTEPEMELLRIAASMQCTDEEVCALLKVSDETLRNWEKSTPEILEALKTGRAEGRRSLRRKQWQVAMGDAENKPNPAMLIWLGKQYLGQTDKQEVADIREERVKGWLKDVRIVSVRRPEIAEENQTTH